MSVSPFDHPKYNDNEQRCGENDEPCVICGKPIKDKERAKWLRVVDGGDRFATSDEVVDEAGDMGSYPIGSGCLRKHRKELATFMK